MEDKVNGQWEWDGFQRIREKIPIRICEHVNLCYYLTQFGVPGSQVVIPGNGTPRGSSSVGCRSGILAGIHVELSIWNKIKGVD
jgi:hypothetical protein